MNSAPNIKIWANLEHVLMHIALVLLSRSLVKIGLERQIKPCICQRWSLKLKSLPFFVLLSFAQNLKLIGILVIGCGPPIASLVSNTSTEVSTASEEPATSIHGPQGS